MKYFSGIFIIVSYLLSSDQIPAPNQKHPILIQGGTIHTISHSILENADILFVDGKITSVGHNLDIPAEVEIIDASGQHVFLVSFRRVLLLDCRKLVQFGRPGIMQKWGLSIPMYGPMWAIIPIPNLYPLPGLMVSSWHCQYRVQGSFPALPLLWCWMAGPGKMQRWNTL